MLHLLHHIVYLLGDKLVKNIVQALEPVLISIIDLSFILSLAFKRNIDITTYCHSFINYNSKMLKSHIIHKVTIYP